MPTIMESKDFWVQQLKQLKSSGLSRKIYCEQNNINYDRFGYWIKRLKHTSSCFVPVKIQATEAISHHTILCTLEMGDHVLKIHDISALSFVLEKVGIK